MNQQESHFLRKESCPKCGSRDNLARYSDGHAHCFGCAHYEPATEGPLPTTNRRPSVDTDFMPIQGDVMALAKRKISEETCRHFGYVVAEVTEAMHRKMLPEQREKVPVGAKVQLAPYCDEHGRVTAQKWRAANKEFGLFGKLKNGRQLFGQHLWRDGGKKIVITEGEIDAMSVSQLQGNKWPVVSVPNGASGAKKALQAELEWLERFEEIILMFDQDEQGFKAVEECAALFSPGKCKVAKLPLKDANEMLQAGRGGEVIEAMWAAKAYRPDGVVDAASIAEKACEDVPMGYPWFLKELTDITFGRRDGEVYGLGAGTGVGKTDVFTQSIAFDLEQGFKVGVLYLEQNVVETLRRIAGKAVGKVLHVPGRVTPEERKEAIDGVVARGNLYLYDNFGSIDWETVKAKIRYMIVGLGCKMIYLDHLTALAAEEEDENGALKVIMAELAGLFKETGAICHYISHLATPEGKPHEEGGRVMIRHFRGSRAIGFWSYFMFGLERDQQAEDEAVRQTTTLRVLKDRNTGQATGKCLYLRYDADTGLLHPTEAPSPFKDETGSATKPQHQDF